MTKVIFRCDGNSEIGLGHITRSLALANMIKSDFECVFLCQNPSETLRKQITEVAQLEVLRQTEKYNNEATAITQNYLQGNEIVVLDGYNFDTEYQKIIKAKGSKLVCIDDSQPFHFVADAIINHVIGINPDSYSCEKYTKLYLGIKYALLRKEFFIKEIILHNYIHSVHNVFLCIGGGGNNTILENIISELNRVGSYSIHIVIGDAFIGEKRLKKYISKQGNCTIYKNISPKVLSSLITFCDISVCTSSTISYEVIALQNLLLVGYLNNYQKKVARHLVENNLGVGIGNLSDKINFAEQMGILLKKQRIINQNQKFMFLNNTNIIKTIFFDLWKEDI